MRLVLIAAATAACAFLTFAGPNDAQAKPALEHSCIAVRDGYQHVAATVAHPQDCCTGRMQCSQFLSTTVVVRPAQDQHT